MAWFTYNGRIQGVSQEWDKASTTAPHQSLIESLYAWERRLRGYDLFSSPVVLEPAFLPFDDSVTAEQWESLAQPTDRHEAEASLVTIPFLLPPEHAVTPTQMAHTLASLRSLGDRLSLEILADARAIRYQVTCSPSDAPAVLTALQGGFPDAALPSPSEGGGGWDALIGGLAIIDEQVDEEDTAGDLDLRYRIVDLGLAEAAYRPLPLLENLNPDPHSALIGALGGLEEGEMAGLQLLLAPANAPWPGALGEWVQYFEQGRLERERALRQRTERGLEGQRRDTHHLERALERVQRGARESEMERSLRHKLASPLWAASLRVFAFTRYGAAETRGQRALRHCQHLVTALGAAGAGSAGRSQSQSVTWNTLLALEDEGYEAGAQLRALLRRRSHRTGMLLSGEELVGLWHPPAPSLRHPRLLRLDPRARELPPHLREAKGVALGLLDQGAVTSGPRRERIPVPWPDEYRTRHAYFLGATRMGKSTLLSNLIAQDLLAGRGLCLIDPHGDLAHDVLRAVPPHREADVLFLDLSDTAFPVSLDLLHAHDEWEKRLLVSDLLSILHRLFAASWGDRLEHILRHALLTLLEDGSEPHTLRDIRPLLSDPAYRDYLLPRLRDPDLQSFWNSEFSGYSASSFAPVFNKLGLLLSSPLVRNIVAGLPNGRADTASQAARLDPAALIRERRVLIVNLAQSLIGDDNAHFLGALLVSKIQLAAMHNLRQGRGERTPFTLYVDEFQNFVVSSFAKILSEAGKAGLSLVMANQFLEQLNENLQTAILSNVGALLSFRVSAASGRRLQSEFGGFFEASDLTDLERGQAIVRLGKAGDSFGLRTFAPLSPDDMGAEAEAPERIIARTRQEICRPRAEVEAGLRQAEAQLAEIRAQWQALQDQKKQEEKGKSAKKPRDEKTARERKPSRESRGQSGPIELDALWVPAEGALLDRRAGERTQAESELPNLPPPDMPPDTEYASKQRTESEVLEVAEAFNREEGTPTKTHRPEARPPEVRREESLEEPLFFGLPDEPETQ